MRVRYTIPGWQPSMPRGLTPVRPPVAFREMIRSRQGVPDTDWRAPLRASPRSSTTPMLEPPALPRGLDLQNAETGRSSLRGMMDRIPSSGAGPAMERLRALLREQTTFENRVLVRATGASFRG